MNKFLRIAAIVSGVILLSVYNTMAWTIDLSNTENDPYSLDLNILLDDGETIEITTYQVNVTPADGFVSVTHTVPIGMFSMEDPTNEDVKIGDWVGAAFTPITLDTDYTFGTVTYDYEITAGLDVFWGYEDGSFGIVVNNVDISGEDLFAAGNLSYNGVVASAVPVPAAAWLLGSGLLGLVGLRRRGR